MSFQKYTYDYKIDIDGAFFGDINLTALALGRKFQIILDTGAPGSDVPVPLYQLIVNKVITICNEDKMRCSVSSDEDIYLFKMKGSSIIKSSEDVVN